MLTGAYEQEGHWQLVEPAQFMFLGILMSKVSQQYTACTA